MSVLDPYEVEWNPRPQVTGPVSEVAQAVGAPPTAIYEQFRNRVLPLTLVKALMVRYPPKNGDWPFEKLTVRRRSRSLHQAPGVAELAREFDARWPNHTIRCTNGEKLVIPPLVEREVPTPVHAEPASLALPEHTSLDPFLAQLRTLLLPQANVLDVVLDAMARVHQERNTYCAQNAQLRQFIDQQAAVLERYKTELVKAKEHIGELDQQLVDARLKPVTPFRDYPLPVIEEAKAVVAKRHPALLEFIETIPKLPGHLN